MKIPSEWTFIGSDVAKHFDQHVREQLPWYDLVTEAIAQIGRHYIGKGGIVYDIGAATGNVGRALEPTLKARNARLFAVEPSHNMVDAYIGPGQVIGNAAEDVQFEDFDLAVCNLVLTFMRPDASVSLLKRLHGAMRPGGAIVIVERMLPTHPYAGIITSRITIAAKLKAGAKAEDILAKELSLGGVQRPLHESILIPYSPHEWFRFGDFAGWLIDDTPKDY